MAELSAWRAACLLCFLASGAAQADAHPDFSGTWNFGSLTPLERPDEFAGRTHFTPDEAQRFAAGFLDKFDALAKKEAGDKFVGYDLWLDFGDFVEPDLRTARIIDPPDGKIPELTPAAKVRREAAVARRETFSDPEVLGGGERCLGGDVAILRAPDNNMLNIVQHGNTMAIIFEFISATRIIPIDQPPLPPADMRFWAGASSGAWEGETLVVTTRNFRPEYSIEGSSEHLTLTERFSLSGEDHLRYEVTVDDPTAFIAPWTVLTYLQRSDKRVYEYACHEGNIRSMQGILRGSRIMEADSTAR